jgi:septal ring factor EnvC (AmiA/AmiB activator)
MNIEQKLHKLKSKLKENDDKISNLNDKIEKVVKQK